MRLAWLASTPLQRLLHAPTARLGLWMMTLNQTHRVWDAWLASTQKLPTAVLALAVTQVALGHRLAAQAQQYVRRVKLVSLALRAGVRVSFAHLAELTRIRIQLPSALTVVLAHTLAAARPHATSVLLVRSTATRVQLHHAQRAWVVSTGRLRQLIS